jgi:hypothetical protein
MPPTAPVGSPPIPTTAFGTPQETPQP